MLKRFELLAVFFLPSIPRISNNLNIIVSHQYKYKQNINLIRSNRIRETQPI